MTETKSTIDPAVESQATELDYRFTVFTTEQRQERAKALAELADRRAQRREAKGRGRTMSRATLGLAVASAALVSAISIGLRPQEVIHAVFPDDQPPTTHSNYQHRNAEFLASEPR